MNMEQQLLYGIFSEGMNSYLHELPRDGCPYQPGSTEREAWLGVGTKPNTVSATAIRNSTNERIRVQRDPSQLLTGAADCPDPPSI